MLCLYFSVLLPVVHDWSCEHFFTHSLFHHLSLCSCSQGAYGVVGLALSGPKVQGASVLLDQDIGTPKAAEETIRRLKAAKIPERNTLGFMFACVGRGQNYYNNQSNVEADAFHRVFPNTPLFGLFGNGEIGCDRIVKDDYTLCDTEMDSLQHEYTTVMTLVHLGWLIRSNNGHAENKTTHRARVCCQEQQTYKMFNSHYDMKYCCPCFCS